MATLEQMKLRSEKVAHYCNLIDLHAPSGLEEVKTATPPIQVEVYALALAKRIIDVEDIPPYRCEAVAEKYLKEAPWRERDGAAVQGTEVHNLVERIAEGEKFEIPGKLALHVESFYNFARTYKLRFVLTEFTVFNLNDGYAGTGDFLAYSDLHPEWGLILGDYKTSESGIWADIALQLAAIRYAQFIGKCKTNSEYHADHTGCELEEDRYTLRGIRTCIGVQLTGRGYQVVPVRVTPNTFKVFQSAINIAKWKTEGEAWAIDKKIYPFVPNEA